MQIIYLDISNKGVVPTIYAKQGDVGRKVQVIFMDSGIPYEIPENANLSVWYEGDSGDGNYTDIGDKSAIVVENNKVTFELITQMLNNDGKGIVCLVMNVGEEQIGSWNIHYLCEKVPGFDSEGASSYFTAFSESVNRLKDVDKTLTKEGYPADAKAVGDRIDNLTAAEIGAAPSGYGLGGYAAMISDLNSLTSGLYKWDAAAENKPFDYGTAIVVGRDSGSGSEICIGVSGTYKGVVVVRTKNSAGWIEEYINPPMVPGEGYRTTERFYGKPVFAKLINLGTMQASGLKNHAIGGVIVSDNAMPVELKAYVTDGTNTYDLMANTFTAGGAYLWNNGAQWYVNVTCSSDMSAFTGKAIVKWIYN